MHLAAFHIDGREGTYRTVMLTSTAAYAALLVDSHHAETGAGITHDADGSSGAMTRTGIAIHTLSQQAVVGHRHSKADADAALFLHRDRPDGSGGTDLAATGTTHTAETFVECHFGLQQRLQVFGRSQHPTWTFAHTELTSGAAA